jgi:NH3-dependent NAD+ synthetase
MALKLITDENVLRELNGDNKSPARRNLRPITDENVLRELNSEPPSKPSFAESIYKAMGIEKQRNPIDFARDLAHGVLEGAGKGAETISQGMGAPTNNKTTQATRLLGNAMTGQPIPSTVEPFKYSDIEKYVEPIKSQKPENWQSRGVNAIGSYLPFGLAGGASLPGQVAAGAAHGYATTEPGQKNLLSDYGMPAGKGGAAIESGVANLLFGGAGKLANQLRPSVMFRGQLPESELARNLAITKGTETGLGDVIGSPFLKKKLENTLTMTPFSGANESLQRTGKEVVNRGENILDEMLRVRNPTNKNEVLHEYDPNQIPQIISKDLNKQFKEHQQKKINFYNHADDLADKQGLKLELPTFSKTAKEYSDAIEATNMLKFDPDTAKIFNKLKNYIKPVKETQVTGLLENEAGHPLLDETIKQHPTLKEANILKGKLNEFANEVSKFRESGMRNMSGIFKRLANSLKNDITSEIEKTGNKELKRSYLQAEKNYEENFSPFLDKEIYRYLGKNANPEEIINSFVKTKPTADLANEITKISRTLSKETKPLLGYSYLSRALDNEGNLNPTKLGTAIEKLKPNQFKALFPDQNLRRELKDYSTLQHMNKEAQNLMFNPKTGQRTTDILMTGLLSALGALGQGHAGALLAPGAAIVGGRAATKALTSESLRESLIREMLKNRTKYTKRTRAAQAGAQGVKRESQEELQEE